MSDTAEVIDLLEETADVMEETLDILEAVQQPSSSGTALVFMGVLGIGIGAAVGYILTKKFLETKYDQMLEDEIASAKKFYGTVAEQKLYSSPDEAVKELIDEASDLAEDASDALKNYQGDAKMNEPETDEPQSRYIFDIEQDITERDPNRPYIISEDEFMYNEPENSQSAITYFAGDETLADERDQVIPNIDLIVGLENLERFGQGSGDPNVVFVRNERLRADYEICRHETKYAHEVLGLEHSAYSARDRKLHGGVRKFRGDDE